MKQSVERRLGIGLSLLLVLCMLFSIPVAALEVENPDDIPEEDIVMYYGYAQVLVDTIVPMIDDFPTFKGEDTDSISERILIEGIASQLVQYEDGIRQIGIEPTEENKRFLAEEVYHIACVYYEEEHRNGGTAQSANRLAVMEVVRFALVEAVGFSNEEASALAVTYYDVYLENISSIRIFGDDRYKTGIKVAEEMKKVLGVDKFEAVIVSCGTNFADALSGSYLAAQKSAPILLVNQHAKIYAPVVSYIQENLAEGGIVYILGGEAAVTADFEKALTGCKVKRLAGENRYETSLIVLDEAGASADQEILVCTGKAFADSLSASATGLPILLVRGDRSMTDSQKAYLKKLDGGKFVVIGGESAINATVFAELEGFGSVERVGGANRYDTSKRIAQRYFPEAEEAALAYASNYPDVLCGGPLAYALKAPLILTKSGKEDAAVEYASDCGITKGYVLGGSNLIADESVRTIFDMTDVQQIIVK